MNKPLSSGILFILSIVLLYLGGVSKGAIGAGLAVAGLVSFVAAIVSAIKNITKRDKKEPSETNREDSKKAKSGNNEYADFERKRNWRIAKVVYWLIILTLIIFSILHVDTYDNSDMQGFAIFVILISLPLYLLYRKVAYYISSGERS